MGSTTNADMKGLAQSLINNDRACKQINIQLKGLKEEQKQIRGSLQDMMQDKQIDVLTKSGSKIELKKVERKSSMNKAYVEATLSEYLDVSILDEAMKKLYDNRPKTTNQLLRLHTPKDSKYNNNNNNEDARTEMSDMSDLNELQNQFNLK